LSLGIEKIAKDQLLKRYFSSKTRKKNKELVHALNKELDRMNFNNVCKFIYSWSRRSAYNFALREIECRTLLLGPEDVYPNDEMADCFIHFHPARVEFVEVSKNVGHLLLSERTEKLIEPLKLYFCGLFGRPIRV